MATPIAPTERLQLAARVALRTGLQLLQFEACMALTNIASLDYESREAICAQDGLRQLEMLQVAPRLALTLKPPDRVAAFRLQSVC